MASGADGVSAHDISQEGFVLWGARTAGGMVLVVVERAEPNAPSGGELVTLTNGSGETVAARLIGPVSGDAPEEGRWRVAGRYVVDSDGTSLSSIVSAVAPGELEPDASGHDWGALGLPHGLETRVRGADEASVIDELALARASSGHRLCEETPLLRLAPGDRVRVDGLAGIVIAVDRRKRTVELDTQGETRVVPFDDVQIEEPT